MSSELHAAAAGGDTREVIRLLAVEGCGLEARDEKGNTVLMVAARGPYFCFPTSKIRSYGSPALVTKLLDMGADPNARNKNDETALVLATQELSTFSSPAASICLNYGEVIDILKRVTK